ncbi:MAG: DUF4874 domain-containing protein [Tannerellaceae bacterium]|nr:DUF4874 domain-containing protein [Tannerellaceae bacterium]
MCISLHACTDTIVIPAGEYEEYGEDPEQPGGDNQPGPIVKIAPLNNPDRGYHFESGYFAHNLVNPFNTSETYPDGFIPKRTEMYKSAADGVTLTQLYIYLTEWVDRDISPEGLQNIQTLFDGLKEHGHKAILRFAYNWTGLNTSGGESEQWILRHLEQLTPFFRENMGLIATIQVGFIGAWGEWHTSPLQNNQAAKNAIVSGLLEAYPSPYCVEIRTPDHKNALTLANESYRSRIGYANDYFTAGEHSHAPGNDFVPGDAWYQQVKQESHEFYMSGEIPYAEQTEWGLFELINPSTTLQILRDHHYSAFDITQNFDLNITSWKNVKVSPFYLDNLNILYSEDYFKDEEGNTVSRSFYEFVRDHLGYRLNLLPSSTIEGANGALNYELNLTNTGFATVVNPKPVYLVCINSNGQVEKEILLENADPKTWQPFHPATNHPDILTHTIRGSVSTGLSGTYRIGIWMPDPTEKLRYNNLYDTKWAISEMISHWQDEQNKYTVNIICEVTF